MQVILVAVAADAEPAGILRRLHDAEPGGAGGVENHIGPAAELAFRELGALRRIAPRGGRGARHVLENLRCRIDEMHALDVTERELADERDVHAADEADLAGLRHHRRGHAAKERRLLLAEIDRLHVRQINDAVDEREFHVGKLLRDPLDGRGLREANRDDDARAAPRHLLHRLLALRRVGDLEFPDRDAGVLGEFRRALRGGLVEGAVELAAEIIDDGRRKFLGRSGVEGDSRDGGQQEEQAG